MKKLITIIIITLLITSFFISCPTVSAQSGQSETYNTNAISTTEAETELDDNIGETAGMITAIIFCVLGGIVVSIIIITKMKRPEVRG